MTLRPIETLAAPMVSKSVADPLAAIVRSSEFDRAREYFETYPPNSLLHNGGVARAFIYLLIRSMQLQRVLEIGTYQAGTTEVIARAIRANGGGHVDTIDPSGGPFIENIIGSWGSDLSSLCTFHLMNSMQYFSKAVREQLTYDLIFVDGDHDFEAAAFDIQRASNILTPSGFMLIDNADQPGVREAALRFLADHPEWKPLGPRSSEMLRQSSIMLLAEGAMSVEGTGLWCLRSPDFIPLTGRLTSFANVPFAGDEIHGLEMKIASGTSSTRSGTVRYKTYLRALPNDYASGLTPLEFEAVGEVQMASLELRNGRMLLRFPRPMSELPGLPRLSEYSKSVEIFLKYIPDPASPECLNIIDRPVPWTGADSRAAS